MPISYCNLLLRPFGRIFTIHRLHNNKKELISIRYLACKKTERDRYEKKYDNRRNNKKIVASFVFLHFTIWPQSSLLPVITLMHRMVGFCHQWFFFIRRWHFNLPFGSKMPCEGVETLLGSKVALSGRFSILWSVFSISGKSSLKKHFLNKELSSQSNFSLINAFCF